MVRCAARGDVQAGRNPQFPETTGARVYLVMLQLLFVAILVEPLLRTLPITQPQGILLGVLAVLMVALLAAPRRLLTTTWFIALLSMGDSTVLSHTMQHVSTIEPWIMCEFLLLMVTVSYAPSIPKIVVLSGLVAGLYALSLYRLGLFETDHVLLLPVLLCVSLALASKNRIVQAEIERLTETDEQTRYRTMTDALTGLPNRAQFLEQVARAIQCNRANKDAQFAILFIDLDGFKPINDRLGHKAGDAVLRHTAKRFQACMRKGDLVGRYGGDEFTLLVHHVIDPADAIRVAERVLAKLKEPIDVGEPVLVGASIGIALSTNLHEQPEDMIRDADGAMYRAKAQGKNQYVFSDQARDIPNTELKDRLKRVVRARW
ncbi:MAG TPA: GGDEF domain-containing protein [Nitrospiraceae bacterium]|jgi:diguanylate cyclase (GGDEF)-like protein|nr:GGDEF domain-containing protein [Nitrospiraceae bacterium]